jgi:hypothetical protein
MPSTYVDAPALAAPSRAREDTTRAVTPDTRTAKYTAGDGAASKPEALCKTM